MAFEFVLYRILVTLFREAYSFSLDSACLYIFEAAALNLFQIDAWSTNVDTPTQSQVTHCCPGRNKMELLAVNVNCARISPIPDRKTRT